MARRSTEPGPAKPTRKAQAAPSPGERFGDRRLHVVTGKGGTGKTTVAAALAIALARGGRRVLLCEVENRQGIAQLFDMAPLPYEERVVASAPGGGGCVLALAIDPEEALLEYLEMFYNLRRAGKALKRIGAVDFATTIAPGLRDVLLTGKLKEAVVRTIDGRDSSGRRIGERVYDHVVVDAPPTGRIGRFLNVNDEVAGLARMGPIRAQADGVMEVLRSHQTAVHLVTLLEEMPVQETLDGVADLHAIGLPIGGIVVNMRRTPLLPDAELATAAAGRLDTEAIAGALKAVDLPAGDTLVRTLIEEAAEHAERIQLEREQRARLEIDRPVVELPLLSHAVDLGALYTLAETLRTELVDA